MGFPREKALPGQNTEIIFLQAALLRQADELIELRKVHHFAGGQVHRALVLQLGKNVQHGGHGRIQRQHRKHPQPVAQSLQLMWQGVAAVFVVMMVIYIMVQVLYLATFRKKDQ